jgi:hypothetical protein
VKSNVYLDRFLRPASIFEALEPRRLFTADVHFSIDAAANVHAISRFIYGVNQSLDGNYANLTFTRSGGNRLTAYNWENNASNAGSDWFFENDNYLGGGNTPGGAIMPMLANASARNAGALVTIPMAGYVSADKNGDGDVRYTGNTWNGTGWVQGTPNPNYLQQRFKVSLPRKGSAFTLTPSTTDGFVYQDEFVNWIKTNYAYGQSDPNRPIWFALDNEPDLWNATHAEVHPAAPTYAEMAQRTIDYAGAIKDVIPNTLVFGPVNYGWQGYIRLQSAPDANGRDFQEFYLQQMRQAEIASGRRLLDVLDVHWYPEAHGTNNIRITEQDTSAATVAARLQAPRSLWDPMYTESSWITQFSTLGPIKLIPRLNTKINTYYPGTKLAITEYNYGGGAHISGGIAQADVLGIFGRDGIFAANEWPLAGNESFIGGAFKMFRNYDGANATFGDTSIGASTDSVANTSVYASVDSTNPNVMTLVAINKTANPLTAGVALSHVLAGAQASVYQLLGSSATPQSAGTISIANPANFEYTMPAYSVSTIRMPAPAGAQRAGVELRFRDVAEQDPRELQQRCFREPVRQRSAGNAAGRRRRAARELPRLRQRNKHGDVLAADDAARRRPLPRHDRRRECHRSCRSSAVAGRDGGFLHPRRRREPRRDREPVGLQHLGQQFRPE